MFSRHHRTVRVLFVLADVVLILAAFEAAYQTRLWLRLEKVFFLLPHIKALLVAFAAAAFVTAGKWLGVYQRLESSGRREAVADTLRQCAVATVAVVLFEYALRLDLSRGFLGAFTVYTWIALSVVHLNARRLARLVRQELGAVHFVLIVGDGERAARLRDTVAQHEEQGVRILGVLGESETGVIPEMLKRQVVDEILFAVDSSRLAAMEEIFLHCDEEGVRTRVPLDFFPHTNSQPYMDRLGNMPMLTFSAAPHDDARLLVKRAVDFAAALAALVVLAPLMLLVALVVRLSSPGPAIFRQERCGLNGRRFVFYKFRSMIEGAEQMRASLAHLNRKSTAFKIPGDPRLTTIGRFLRKFSIDEWPQLWNVLRGDMSLVGPRPAVPEEVEKYERWQRRRLRMRPGLTCLWILNGRDNLDFETWMRLDMEYIDNWSLTLDWKILLKTVPRVLTGKGAY